MSSLAETYALACGVKLSEPEINQAFYPLSCAYDKAVLIHAFAGGVNNNQATFPAKIYDYFNEVVALIKPILDKHGFVIYQIGGAGEPPLRGVESLCGKTNFHQTAFLLKNCALLIGNDSMNVHIAAAFGTPIVAVYGPTDPKNHGPYWKNKDKTFLIESHRFGAKRPSYQAMEPQKTINLIKPEQVTNKALLALGLEEKMPINTFYIGEGYLANILEVIPDAIISPNFAKDAILNIRMDYHFDEEKMLQNLAGHKCSIVLNDKIDLEKVRQLKQNLVSIRVRLSEKISTQFIKKVKAFGVPYQFFVEDMEKEALASLRFKLYDYVLFDHFESKTKENFLETAKKYSDSSIEIEGKKLYYRTNKFILSSAGIFMSKAAYDAKLPITCFEENEQLIIDTPEFWKEQQHFWIYEKENKQN